MPEYIMPGKDAPSFNALPAFTRGYIEAGLFTAPEEMSHAGFSDISPEYLEEIRKDCDAFYEANRADIDMITSDDAHPDYDEEAAGRDFWYDREGHGVGYWDRGFTGDFEAAATRLSEAARVVGPVSDSSLGLPENDTEDEPEEPGI